MRTPLSQVGPISAWGLLAATAQLLVDVILGRGVPDTYADRQVGGLAALALL